MRVKLKLEQLGCKEVLKFAALDNYFFNLYTESKFGIERLLS